MQSNVTTFQSKIKIAYQPEDQQLTVFMPKRKLNISTATANNSYQFTFKDDCSDEMKIVSIGLENLASALKVKQEYLKDVIALKNITRLQDVLQEKKRVKRLHKHHAGSQKEQIWQDLIEFLKEKKKLEEDKTFLPHTSRTFINYNLNCMPYANVLKCDCNKVRFLIIPAGKKILGQGARSIVGTCLNITNGKILAHSRRDKDFVPFNVWRESIIKETNMVAYLKEKEVEGIMSYLFASQDVKEQAIEVLMPYYSGSVIEMIGRLSSEERGLLFMHVLESIKEMHANGVVHRDIKPDNILVKKDKCLKFKLIDFEYACLISDIKATKTIQATSLYVAPEVFSAAVKGEAPDWQKHDMWSLGILLYQLHFGHHPLDGQEEQLIENVAQGKLSEAEKQMAGIQVPNFNDKKFEVIEELLKNLLNKEMSQRWSAEEAYRYLKEQTKESVFKVGLVK